MSNKTSDKNSGWKVTENRDAVENLLSAVTIKETRVRSLLQAKLEYTGKVSGRQYVWNGAGQEVPVQDEDVPELLSKRLGKRSCCGNGETKIFELA